MEYQWIIDGLIMFCMDSSVFMDSKHGFMNFIELITSMESVEPMLAQAKLNARQNADRKVQLCCIILGNC